MTFADRADAGRKLATMLAHYRDKTDTMILALPRGGIPVAYEIADALHLPMDVFPAEMYARMRSFPALPYCCVRREHPARRSLRAVGRQHDS